MSRTKTFLWVFLAALWACKSSQSPDMMGGGDPNVPLPPENAGSACSRDGLVELATCPGFVPCNPNLAVTPWPTYHLNGYAQASTPIPGLDVCDDVEIQSLVLPDDLAAGSWLVLSEKYPDGSRTVWGSSGGRKIFKAKLLQETLELVDTYSLEEGSEESGARSVAINIRMLPGNVFFAPDTARRRLLRLREADPTNPASPIVLDAEWVLPPEVKGQPVQLRETYDGWSLFITDQGIAAAVKDDFSEYRVLDLEKLIGDRSCIQNGFPVDEAGNVYVSCFRQFVKLRWVDADLRVEWRVPYDFLGPGCEATEWTGFYFDGLRVLLGDQCTGSGTTATLLGTDANADQLVVVTDGHSPQNRLVAFWRNNIPDDWQGLAGYDRRVAGVLALPHGSPDGAGFTIQNSPAALDYDVFVAAWAGPNLPCDPERGVQAVRWDPEANAFSLLWERSDVSFNGVLTVSRGSDLVYSSGRSGCDFVMQGLDRETGETRFSFPMGEDIAFKDPGNQLVINDDRSMLFAGGRGVVRLHAP